MMDSSDKENSHTAQRKVNDPSVWLKYVQNELNLVGGDVRKCTNLAKVFESAYNSVTKEYFQTEDYVSLCLGYARFLIYFGNYDQCKDLLKCLKINRIGQLSAELYITYAHLESALGDDEKAKKHISKGMELQAQPRRELEKYLADFKHAITVAPLILTPRRSPLGEVNGQGLYTPVTPSIKPFSPSDSSLSTPTGKPAVAATPKTSVSYLSSTSALRDHSPPENYNTPSATPLTNKPSRSTYSTPVNISTASSTTSSSAMQKRAAAAQPSSTTKSTFTLSSLYKKGGASAIPRLPPPTRVLPGDEDNEMSEATDISSTSAVPPTPSEPNPPPPSKVATPPLETIVEGAEQLSLHSHNFTQNSNILSDSGTATLSQNNISGDSQSQSSIHVPSSQLLETTPLRRHVSDGGVALLASKDSSQVSLTDPALSSKVVPPSDPNSEHHTDNFQAKSNDADAMDTQPHDQDRQQQRQQEIQQLQRPITVNKSQTQKQSQSRVPVYYQRQLEQKQLQQQMQQQVQPQPQPLIQSQYQPQVVQPQLSTQNQQPQIPQQQLLQQQIFQQQQLLQQQQQQILLQQQQQQLLQQQAAKQQPYPPVPIGQQYSIPNAHNPQMMPPTQPQPVMTQPLPANSYQSKRSKAAEEQLQRNFELASQWGGGRIFYVNKKPYIVLETVGKGGSSKVFKVMSANLEILALKQVNLDKADQSTIENYMNEINLLDKLKGKSCIIQLIDAEINQANAEILIVLEYGESDLNFAWQSIMQNSRAHSGNFLRVFWQQMLEAVHTVHQQRIVHSDLKLANFVLVKGSVKLIDFGIAKVISSDTTNVSRDELSGTINYMSPESLTDTAPSGEGTKLVKHGRPSDVWSLGCILYQMVFGHPPFHSLSLAQKFKCIPDPNYPINYPPHPDQGLIEVLRACLQRDASRRPTIPQLLNHPFLMPTLCLQEMDKKLREQDEEIKKLKLALLRASECI